MLRPTEKIILKTCDPWMKVIPENPVTLHWGNQQLAITSDNTQLRVKSAQHTSRDPRKLAGLGNIALVFWKLGLDADQV